MIKILVFTLAFLLHSTAYAVAEKDFNQVWSNDVMPYFATGQQRTYINSQGLKLNYFSFVRSRNTKTIVLLPGRTEPAIKYAEFIYDMRAQKNQTILTIRS